jgi:hypothetical protein
VGTIGLAIVAVLAGSVSAFAITPEFREGSGSDTIMNGPELTAAGRAVLFTVGVGGVLAIVWLLSRAIRSGGIPPRVAEVTAVSLACGVLAGLGLRVVTARTNGANIGGALILLVAPWAGVAFVAYIAVRLRTIRKDTQ